MNSKRCLDTIDMFPVGMTVLSLFDGMSCGRIALDRADIKVARYYASELDKYAIKVSNANYPDIIQLGDVTKWREWDIDWSSIDLLIGGSPCQGFSFAGKQLAFDDPRSKLFFVYVDILNHIKSVNHSVKFLLENVKMKKEFLNVISEFLGVQPVFINSALVSAQNRQRYYWVNWGVSQPKDKGVMLSDVLDLNLPSCAVGARIVGRRLNSDGKREDYNKDIPLTQVVETRSDKKANCMTTVGKDSMVAIRDKSKCLRVGGRNSPLGCKQEWDSPFVKTDKKLRLKNNQAKVSCLTGGANSGGNHSDMDIIHSEYFTRRYSVVECERLQTVPDNYTNHASNTQRYKMLGNGWTVDVIAHIFQGLK